MRRNIRKKAAAAAASCALLGIPLQAIANPGLVSMSARIVSYTLTTDEFVLTADNREEAGIPASGDVIIPETVEYEGQTVTVTGIGDGAFMNNTDITSVILPDTVTAIGESAFSGCTSLVYVELPESLEYLGKAAFQLCTSLPDVDLPEGLDTLANFSFNHCTGYKGSYFTIPASLTGVGVDNRYITHMFYNFGTDAFREFRVEEGNEYFCAEDGILYTSGGVLVSIPRGRNISVYEMPDDVTGLGELSFSRNPYIHKVVISDSLEISSVSSEAAQYYNLQGNTLSIAEYGFTDVNEYEAKETNTRYASSDGILYTKDFSALVAVPGHYNGVMDIPEGVTSWREDALWGYQFEYGFPSEILSGVTQIHIPASMQDIPDSQITVINDMVRLYGTAVSVAPGNARFYVDGDGNLIKGAVAEEPQSETQEESLPDETQDAAQENIPDEAQTETAPENTEEDTQNSVPEGMQDAVQYEVRYTTDYLNLRDEPGGEIKTVAEAGSMLYITETRDGWAKTSDGYWCWEEYLD